MATIVDFNESDILASNEIAVADKMQIADAAQQ